jgi:hypothetical protein
MARVSRCIARTADRMRSDAGLDARTAFSGTHTATRQRRRSRPAEAASRRHEAREPKPIIARGVVRDRSPLGSAPPAVLDHPDATIGVNVNDQGWLAPGRDSSQRRVGIDQHLRHRHPTQADTSQHDQGRGCLRDRSALCGPMPHPAVARCDRPSRGQRSPAAMPYRRRSDRAPRSACGSARRRCEAHRPRCRRRGSHRGR